MFRLAEEQSTMKYSKAVLISTTITLLAIVICVEGCKKDEQADSTSCSSSKWVSTHGNEKDSVSFVRLSDGRVSKILFANGSYSEVTYYADSFVTNDYNVNNILQSHSLYKLNSNQYISSCVIRYSNHTTDSPSVCRSSMAAPISTT